MSDFPVLNAPPLPAGALHGEPDVSSAVAAEADDDLDFDTGDTIVRVLQGASRLCALLPEQQPGDGLIAMRSARDTPERFRIRLANSEGRRSSASYLIRKRYSWRGYDVGDAPARANPSGLTLVANHGDTALATISVGFDSQRGLLVDDLYREEVDGLRRTGSRICEFTKLAVETGESSREVLAMIFHIAFIYARRMHGCDDLLIEVNPRHVRFYRAALGFEQLGEPRMCPRVNAPAVLMRLRLDHCEEQIRLYGGQREKFANSRSLYPLAFSQDEENGIVGRLRLLEE